MSNPGGGREAGEGSTPKKRLKTTSPVWEHFTKAEIDGHTKAKCKYCNEDLSYTQGTTTHLKRHLISCNKVPNGGIAQPLTIPENNERATIAFGVGEEDRNFGLTQKKICEEQVKKAILACLPFAPPDYKKFGSSLMIMDMDMEKETWEYYQREKEKLVTQLGNLTSLVSFSIEIMYKMGWISIAAHFINDDFKLIKKLIGFKKLPDTLEVPGIIGSCISDWKLGNKIFSFTTRDFDNIFLIGDLPGKFLSKMLLDNNHDYYDEFFISCFKEDVSCFKEDVEDYCSFYLGRNYSVEMSHIMKIFKDLMVSPDIRLKFNEIAEEKGLPPVNESLSKDEWKAFKGALLYKEVFCERSLTEICQPDCIRWTELEKAANYLEPINPIIDLLSNFKYPTSNLYFQNLYIIWDSLDLADYYDDDDIYHRICMSICVACVLDPRYKLTYFEYLLLKEDSKYRHYLKGVTDKVRKLFHTLFGIYAKEEINQASPSSIGIANTQEGCTSSSFTNQGLSKNIGAYALYVKELRTTKASIEINRYLSEETVDIEDTNFDLLGWWNQNRSRYPILSRMARDFLAAPACIYSVEESLKIDLSVLQGVIPELVDFSVLQEVSPELVQAVICSKDWILSDV